MKLPVDVLLVDDNQADVTFSVRAISTQIPVERIHIARDGEAALGFILGCALESRPMPRLILLDLKLPKVSGFDVLMELKNDSRAKLIPVVVLSSSKQPKDILKSYKLGANSYLQKPLDYDEFRDAVGRVARYWLHLNQGPPISIVTNERKYITGVLTDPPKEKCRT